MAEIRPKEFSQFIGKEMKLRRWRTAAGWNHEPGKRRRGRCSHAASGILTFYLGKNTPERKDFIMGNLVAPVEA